jgi:MFS family permease
MAGVPAAGRPSVAGWAAWILAALFLAIAALIFTAIYYTLPYLNHFPALIAIGILALFFALGSYLAEAASRQPTIQRALGWGFFGMGFAVLIAAVALGPTYGVLSTVTALVGLAVTLGVLFIAVGLMMWRARAVARTKGREAPREAWRKEPTPSALSYSAATSPSVPVVTTPPAESPPPWSESPPPRRSP